MPLACDAGGPLAAIRRAIAIRCGHNGGLASACSDPVTESLIILVRSRADRNRSRGLGSRSRISARGCRGSAHVARTTRNAGRRATALPCRGVRSARLRRNTARGGAVLADRRPLPRARYGSLRRACDSGRMFTGRTDRHRCRVGRSGAGARAGAGRARNYRCTGGHAGPAGNPGVDRQARARGSGCRHRSHQRARSARLARWPAGAGRPRRRRGARTVSGDERHRIARGTAGDRDRAGPGLWTRARNRGSDAAGVGRSRLSARRAAMPISDGADAEGYAASDAEHRAPAESRASRAVRSGAARVPGSALRRRRTRSARIPNSARRVAACPAAQDRAAIRDRSSS